MCSQMLRTGIRYAQFFRPDHRSADLPHEADEVLEENIVLVAEMRVEGRTPHRARAATSCTVTALKPFSWIKADQRPAQPLAGGGGCAGLRSCGVPAVHVSAQCDPVCSVSAASSRRSLTIRFRSASSLAVYQVIRHKRLHIKRKATNARRCAVWVGTAFGTAGAMVTMAIHPTGRDLPVSPEAAGHVAALSAAVHSLAIISIGVTLVGATGLAAAGDAASGRHRRRAYCVLIAVGHRRDGGGDHQRLCRAGRRQGAGRRRAGGARGPAPALPVQRHASMRASPKSGVVASAVAIALWCVALLRTCDQAPAALAWAGLAVAAVTLAALVIGHLRPMFMASAPWCSSRARG